MYSPSKKNQNENIANSNQTGGDYITGMSDPSSLRAPIISASTLSTIGFMAGVSSFDEIASFNTQKIGELIDAVTARIAVENASIIENQTKIADIEGQINAIPNGLQAEYDKANAEYIAIQSEYTTAQSRLTYEEGVLHDKLIALAELSSLSSMYESTIDGYQKEYSTIWESINENNRAIDSQNKIYEDRVRAYLDYQGRYSDFEKNRNSTLDALALNSSFLSTATSDYFSSSTLYGNLLNDYVNFSTQNMSVSQYLFGSTNKHLCSLMMVYSTQYANYASTSTALYLANMNVSSAQATYDYRNALSVELSSIIEYNMVEEELNKLLINFGIQSNTTGNVNDIEYFSNQVRPTGQELTYNTLLVMLSSLSSLVISTTHVRETLQENQTIIDLASLKAILDAADGEITAAQYAYYLAQENEKKVLSTIAGLEGRIRFADKLEDDYLSTLEGLSTIYIQELSLYNQRNLEIQGYVDTERLLNNYLRSSLLTLYLLSTQSSMYNISAGIYTESYIMYSTLEAVVQSTIDGYSTTKGYVTSTIEGLDAEVGELSFSVESQFGTLGTNATTYYTDLSSDLNNELDAYKYGVQEWNSFIAYITSELLIRKLNLYTSIDSITFSLAGATPEEQNNLTAERTRLSGLQASIQGIINSLNPLDIKFELVLLAIETERQNKASFVTTRTKLTKFEIEVLQNPTKHSVVQAEYIFQLGILNTRVMNINSNILQRNDLMSKLYDIINPQLTLLNGLNIFSFTLPDPLDVNVGPFNTDMTEYQLLPLLDYGLNITDYPLVFTDRVPSTITDLSVLPSSLFKTVRPVNDSDPGGYQRAPTNTMTRTEPPAPA